MKTYNEKVNCFILSDVQPVNNIDSEIKDGDIIPHYNRVDVVHILRHEFNVDGIPTGKIEITEIRKDEIIEMLRNIEEIESNQFNAPYSCLPF